MEIQGLELFGKQLGDFIERLESAGAAALYAEASNIMGDSKEQVPVRDGVLEGSGYVTEPKRDSRGWEVEIGYGGPASKYAEKQHELTHLRHKVGKAKYLEDPMNDAQRTFSQNLGALARRYFKSGKTSLRRGSRALSGHPTGPWSGAADRMTKAHKKSAAGLEKWGRTFKRRSR
jgi:hypothetical protein